MYIQIRCPECKANFDVGIGDIGTLQPCRYCRAQIRIPRTVHSVTEWTIGPPSCLVVDPLTPEPFMKLTASISKTVTRFTYWAWEAIPRYSRGLAKTIWHRLGQNQPGLVDWRIPRFLYCTNVLSCPVSDRNNSTSSPGIIPKAYSRPCSRLD